MANDLKPAETDDYKKRQDIAKLAKVNRLDRFTDLDLIQPYAQKFGLDPDYVYETKSMDDVIIWLLKWKEESEFEERRNNIQRMMEDAAK